MKYATSDNVALDDKPRFEGQRALPVQDNVFKRDVLKAAPLPTPQRPGSESFLTFKSKGLSC